MKERKILNKVWATYFCIKIANQIHLRLIILKIILTKKEKKILKMLMKINFQGVNRKQKIKVRLM